MNIPQMFSEIAPTYDRVNRVLSGYSDVSWRRRAIRRLSRRTAPAILDLCAGTLDMTTLLLDRFPDATITAVDASQAMLDCGVEKIPAQHQKQVACRCEDALHLSSADSAFDIVTCAFGMRNLPDQNRALGEIRRVLRPRGALLILEFFQPATTAARLFARTYGRVIIPWLGGLLSKQPTAYQYLRESTAQFYPLGAYRALLQAEGFHDVSTRHVSGGIANIVHARRGDHG
jgi:ubiquinone/menaquinone biosynthesis methyltransferase